ncbi:hypothetical protein ACLOJK_025812 [Asimina triloba]
MNPATASRPRVVTVCQLRRRPSVLSASPDLASRNRSAIAIQAHQRLLRLLLQRQNILLSPSSHFLQIHAQLASTPANLCSSHSWISLLQIPKPSNTSFISNPSCYPPRSSSRRQQHPAHRRRATASCPRRHQPSAQAVRPIFHVPPDSHGSPASKPSYSLRPIPVQSMPSDAVQQPHHVLFPFFPFDLTTRLFRPSQQLRPCPRSTTIQHPPATHSISPPVQTHLPQPSVTPTHPSRLPSFHPPALHRPRCNRP